MDCALLSVAHALIQIFLILCGLGCGSKVEMLQLSYRRTDDGWRLDSGCFGEWCVDFVLGYLWRFFTYRKCMGGQRAYY